MPTPPVSIHPSAVDASFQLLFLSEGFLLAEEALFVAHCRAVMAELLTIPPFRLAQQQIAAWAMFSASQQQGIGSTAGATAFEFVLGARGELRTRKPAKLIAVIRDIQPVAIGPGTQAPLPINGGDIWLEEGTRGSRAVCVIVRLAARAATTIHTYSASELTDPPQVTDDVRGVLPFVATTMWPALPDSAPQYVNPAVAAAAVLARELGAVMGLGYESEGVDPASETYSGADAPYPNITADTVIRGADGKVDIGRVKWRSAIPAPRRAKVVEFDHPGLLAPGEDETAEVPRYQPIADQMAAATVLLRHPKSPGAPGDTSTVTAVRYTSRGKRLLLRPDAHLVEGGHGYRRLIYRPGVECLMRLEGADIAESPTLTRRAVMPYCDVCARHLQEQLTGLHDFRFGAVRILRGQAACSNRQRVRSRLAEAFVAYVNRTALPEPPPDDDSLLCVEATLFRFESFFSTVLGWQARRDIGVTTPGHTWYADPISWPKVGNQPLSMFHIWMSAAAALRQRHLGAWAGLGPPGALAFVGLGCLVNRFRQQTSTVNGAPVTYRIVNGLTLAELTAVSPGSLLQIWKSEADYLSVVGYANGVHDVEPKDVPGHSLVYMGTDASGQPLVIDQETALGTPERLTTGWRAPYPFWIAAQWYDADNIRATP